jgi:hypothetical protein
MDIITRQTALLTGAQYFYTGLLCKHGHISKRSVSNCGCYQCQLNRSASFRQKNPDYHHAYNGTYYPDNVEKIAKLSTEYYARMKLDNPELLKERHDKNHKKYRTRNKESLQKRNKLWRQSNLGKLNAITARRRACKLKATPKWANLEIIKEIYIDCEHINILNRLMGGIDVMVVDHIIPLQGNEVCGLHIETNLRIIPAPENNTKHNKLQEHLL